MWDGSRLASGAADPSKTVDLTAGPVASLSDLVAQLKSHSSFDPTVCDLQNVDGRLTVVWKIQGAPSAPGNASLQFMNPSASSDTNLANTTWDSDTHSLTVDHDTNREIDSSTIDDAVTHYGRECIPQTFTFTNSKTNWFVAPGPDTHFELRIGNRALSADNVTSAADLVEKLKKDSDYGFVLEEAGHPPGFPLFEASMDIDDAAGNPAQAFTIHFGKFASSIGSLRQTTNNVTIAETDKAITALDFIDKAADVVNDRRARMGATMSRIEYTINNLMNVVQNTEEAKSRILDTDYAAESAALAKAQVLAQAGTAMLAQANQSQQYVLNLLKGM
jgi:flagellin-like hook-associated protein FlgL